MQYRKFRFTHAHVRRLRSESSTINFARHMSIFQDRTPRFHSSFVTRTMFLHFTRHLRVLRVNYRFFFGVSSILRFMRRRMISFTPFISHFQYRTTTRHFSRVRRALITDGTGVLFSFYRHRNLTLIFQRNRVISTVLRETSNFRRQFLRHVTRNRSFTYHFRLYTRDTITLFRFVRQRAQSFKSGMVRDQLRDHVKDTNSQILRFVRDRTSDSLHHRLHSQVANHFAHRDQEATSTQIRFSSMMIRQVQVRYRLSVATTFSFRNASSL